MEFKELTKKVYKSLTEEPQTVDAICCKVGTEDDFKVIQALNILEYGGKARSGLDKVVYPPEGGAIILTTYQLPNQSPSYFFNMMDDATKDNKIEECSEEDVQYIIDTVKKVCEDPAIIKDIADFHRETSNIDPKKLLEPHI